MAITTTRRSFLTWLSAGTTTAALIACDTSEPGGGGGAPDAAGGANGPDAGDPMNGPDAAPQPACVPTTPDALGPFFEDGAPMRSKIAEDGEPGERLVMNGVVVADDCVTPVVGALLDVWQADAEGNYFDAGADYRLRGRMLSGADGRFQVDTIRPGNYALSPGAWRPAHLHFIVAQAGFAPVTTQVYFAGDPFLPPNDGCTTCGSNDPARIVELAGDAAQGWTGELRIILART